MILTNLLQNFNFDSGYDLPLSEGKLNGFIYFGTAKLLMPQIGHFISGSTIGKYSQIKSFVLGVPYPGSDLQFLIHQVLQDDGIHFQLQQHANFLEFPANERHFQC